MYLSFNKILILYPVGIGISDFYLHLYHSN